MVQLALPSCDVTIHALTDYLRSTSPTTLHHRRAGVALARPTAEDELVRLGEIRKALEAQPNSEVMVQAVTSLIEERSAALGVGRPHGD